MTVLVKYRTERGNYARAVIEAPSTWAALDLVLAMTQAKHGTARRIDQ